MRRIHPAESDSPEQYGGKKRVSSLRLPSHDIGILRLLWGGLASRMGLGSNYANMIAGMQDKEARVVSVKPPDGMQDGKQSMKFHSWNGNVMHIKSTPIVRRGFVCRCSGDCGCEVELTSLEKWACWSNHLHDRDGSEVQIAYHAIEYMIENGQSGLVGILFRMYGGVTPFWRFGQFQDLEDLVPVAPDTPTVIKFVSHNEEDKLSSWDAMKHLMVRRSGDTKAQDRSRESTTQKIKAECIKILIRASSAYMEAKKHV